MKGDFMSTLQFGVVVFFNSESAGYEYGYVKPSKQRRDRENYYFKLTTATSLVEEKIGEVSFKPKSIEEIQPRYHEQLVFVGIELPKGPACKMWNTVNNYCRAVAVINNRPWKECPLCRVVTLDSTTGKDIIIWEGYKAQLLEILSTDKHVFIKKPIDWYSSIWCFELLVEGWKKIPNPLNTSLEFVDKRFYITEEQRKILEDPRFKVRDNRRVLSA